MSTQAIETGIETAIHMMQEGETLAKFRDAAIQAMDAHVQVNGAPNVWIANELDSERVTRKLPALWDRDATGNAVML